jgi:hypothetical protein
MAMTVLTMRTSASACAGVIAPFAAASATASLKAGVLDRADDGRIEFPYDEIHVDFVLRAA